MRAHFSTARVAAIVLLTLAVGVTTFYLTRPQRITDPEIASSTLAPVTPTSQPTTPTPSATPTKTKTAKPKPTARPSSRAAAPANKPPKGDEPPTRLILRNINVDMTVQPVGVTKRGVMQIPENVRVAGWYRYGPGPTAKEGAVVLAAHVDSRQGGKGPLARLSSARPGQTVTVGTANGSKRYKVRSVNRYDKDAIDLDRVFDRSGRPRLHVITCGGSFDVKTGHYEDNVVLVADEQ